MRNILRWAIPLGCLAVIALLLALNRRWPLVGSVITSLVLALMIVGSAVKLWRVGHGDFRITSDAFWLPKRWQSWIFGGTREKGQAPHPQERQNSN